MQARCGENSSKERHSFLFLGFLERSRRLMTILNALQVEHHGSCSLKRLQNLSAYINVFGWLHATAVLLLTPLPCLVIIVLADVIPLADPRLGVGANTSFFIRELYAYLVFTFFALHYFRIGVPMLPYPTWKLLRDTHCGGDNSWRHLLLQPCGRLPAAVCDVIYGSSVVVTSFDRPGSSLGT